MQPYSPGLHEFPVDCLLTELWMAVEAILRSKLFEKGNC